MINIVTHWQNFHIDEIFAIVLLKVYLDPDITITRTREQEKLKQACADPDVFVIDVGGDYNPSLKNFDHHQAQFQDTWDDGTPFSSCGLIWRWLKEQGAFKGCMNTETIREMEERFIKRVDKQDNGIEYWNETTFITIYNRKANNDVQDIQFQRALSVAEDFYRNMFGAIRNDIKSHKEAVKAIQQSEYLNNVIVMKSNNEFAFKKLNTLSNKKIAVLPYKGKSVWKIQSLPKINESYSMQCPMPKEWRGLSHKELEYVSGIKGMVFCHKTGFMCVFEGDLESAINIANDIYLYNSIN